MKYYYNSNHNNSTNQNSSFDFKNPFNYIDDKMKIKFRKTQRFTALALALIFALVYYYVFLPAINIRAVETWVYFGAILAILVFIGGKSLKIYKILRYALVGMIVLFLLLNLVSLPLFQSKNYANVISLETSDFQQDIEQLPISKIPTLDRESSVRVGRRKMGELLELVSQFDIDETTYTQINYQDQPVRVTPLMYNGFIKYIFNSGEGLPGYLKVDIVSGESELVQLEEKIKISKQDYFFRDTMRYARLRYPFEIIKNANFEIDEQGTPYWIVATYKPKVFFFDALDVDGAILINASTGEHQKYDLEDIPQWVDRVYESDSIIRQLDWNGHYQGGFFNSIFAQRNVLSTTEGYNYLALNDDVYLYTGYTSVAADESNVGFILSNLRTKETKFYPVSSAEEYSAMESAEGAVQETRYKATFPILLNIDGKPTYFLSLKDDAGLIKQYAFIDAQNYQRVAVGESVTEALANHRLGNLGAVEEDPTNVESLQASGNISDIHQLVIDGTSYFYLKIDGSDHIYVASIKASNNLPFMKVGDKINFIYKDNGQLKEITSFE